MSFEKEEKGSGTRRKARVCALQMLFGFDLVSDDPFDPQTFWSELGYEEIRSGTVAQIAAYRDEVTSLAARIGDFRTGTKKFDPLGKGNDYADALKGIQQALTRHEEKYLQAVNGLAATGRLEAEALYTQLALARTNLETLSGRIARTREAYRERRDKETLDRYLMESAHTLQEITKLADSLPAIQKSADTILPVREFATRIAAGTVQNMPVVDDRIRSRAEHWRIERMAIVDRNILRLAVYEFLFEDTPKTVVINEALEIARRFSTFEATQFINGILDAIKLDLEKAAGADDQKADSKSTSS